MMVGNGNFGKLLDKATSQLVMEPDMVTLLDICAIIRQGDVQPKVVLSMLKKKLANTNPHVVSHSLLVLEYIVKNCPTVHEELASRAFLDTLHELVKKFKHSNIRNKILELLQAWEHVFKNNPKFDELHDIMKQLKAEGYTFPPLRESEAMFSATNAPIWVDGESCHRCRVQFSFINRKHHCRACGQVFCGECTTKSTTLPKFGIEKEVRVCDTCFESSKSSTSKTSSKTEELPYEYLSSSLYQQKQQPPKKSEDELREEEELQMAIALSKSEAESKEKEKERAARMKLSSSPTYNNYKQDPIVAQSQSDETFNPELAKYLNRSYWESRTPANSTDNLRPTSPSAPSVTAIPIQNHEQKFKIKENGMVNNESEEFMNTLRSQVEIFINRMKSNSSRGRAIQNDTSVQTLFVNITAMHSTLLGYIKEHDDKRLHFERLQDKLNQVKDARAALDALREEHREKLRKEAKEAEKLRQLQMARKLEIMRKKKEEYLQYQKQLVFQRVQEQEREMQMRQEQQKQQALMGNPQFPMGYMVHGQQFPPNSAPPVGPYHPYGQPHSVMLGQGMISGQPPHSAPPQMGHMVGPPQGMGQIQHPQMQIPPGYNPMANQNIPQTNPVGPGQSIPNQDPGVQQMPQQMGMVYPPQMVRSNPPQMTMVQQPNQNPNQAMLGPRPSVPQQYSQQPGAPPASPQIPQQSQQEETQTAELISFD